MSKVLQHLPGASHLSTSMVIWWYMAEAMYGYLFAAWHVCAYCCLTHLQQDPLPAAVHGASTAGNAVGWAPLAKVVLSFQAPASVRMNGSPHRLPLCLCICFGPPFAISSKQQVCHVDCDSFGIAGQHSTHASLLGPQVPMAYRVFHTPFAPHLGRPHLNLLAVSCQLAIETNQLTAISWKLNKCFLLLFILASVWQVLMKRRLAGSTFTEMSSDFRHKNLCSVPVWVLARRSWSWQLPSSCSPWLASSILTTGAPCFQPVW